MAGNVQHNHSATFNGKEPNIIHALGWRDKNAYKILVRKSLKNSNLEVQEVKSKKVKLSRYTPWRYIGGQEL
jgi:hypothetical protein